MSENLREQNLTYMKFHKENWKGSKWPLIQDHMEVGWA